MASPTCPLGPYVGNSNDLLPGGRLWFLDPTTDLPKSIYTDGSLSVELQNPMPLGSDGKTEDQVYLGYGGYLLKLYAVVDASNPAPVFPDDYSLVSEWTQEGLEVPAVAPNTIFTVGTIDALSAADPAEVGDVVQVTGYYDEADIVGVRAYAWSPASVATSNGGSVVAAAGYATGRWLLKRDSDLVDVRWFGALPGGTIDCNSPITSAAAYAQNIGATLYFPAGVYRVAPGAVAINSKLRIDDGASVFVRIADEYAVYISGEYSIGLTGSWQNGASVGTSNLDFNANSWRGEVRPAWYVTAFDGMLPYIGAQAVRIIDEQTAFSMANRTIDRLVFSGLGTLSLEHDANTLTINDIVILDQDTPERISGTLAPLSRTVLGSQVVLRTSNLSTLAIQTIDGGEASLLVDTNVTMLEDGNAPKWGLIDGVGGALVVSSGFTCNMGNVKTVVGRVLAAQEATITNGSQITAANYFLDDVSRVKGFLGSYGVSGGVADFNGLNIGSLALNVVGLGDVIIRACRTTGGVTGETSTQQGVYLDQCVVSGALSGAGMDINLSNGSQFAASTATIRSLTVTDASYAQMSAYGADIVENVSVSGGSTLESVALSCQEFYAKDATLIGVGDWVQRFALCDVRNCVVYCSSDAGLMFKPTAGTYTWRVVFDDNDVTNGYMLPQGTGTVKYIYIRRNDFKRLNDIQYIPIASSGMTATVDDSSFIRVCDNTPKQRRLSTDPAGANTELYVRETDVSAYREVASTGAIDYDLRESEQTSFFVPYSAIGWQLGFSQVTHYNGGTGIFAGSEIEDIGSGVPGIVLGLADTVPNFIRISLYH